MTRAKANLRFFESAPLSTGKRGRPRTKGKRLPSLKELRKDGNLHWTEHVIENYRDIHETRLLAAVDCLWASAEGGTAKVCLVFVKTPEDGPGAPAFCLITKASLLSIEQIVDTYARELLVPINNP